MDDQKLKDEMGWEGDASDPRADTVDVEDSLVDSDDRVRPRQTKREQPLHRRVLPRVVLVFSSIGFVSFLFWQLIAGNLTPVSQSESKNQQFSQDNENTEAESEPTKDEQIAELKRKLAFANQDQALKENQSSSKEELARPSPESKEPKTENPAPPAKSAVNPSLPPQPSPQTRFIPKPSPKTAVNQSQDPKQLWLQASQVGSYGNVQPPSTASAGSQISIQPTSQQELMAGVSGGTGNPPTISANNRPVVTEPNPNRHSSTSIPNNKSLLMIGTQATGKLETSIAWASNQQVPNRKFLIQLITPLKANETVIIPEGTRLVGEIDEVSNSGLLQMSLISVINDGHEKPLPPRAILVLGEGGRPLKAEAEIPNRTGSDLAAFAIAGISKATELANESEEEFIFNSNGGSFRSTTNNNPNYLSSAVQGATEEILERMQQRNRRALERTRGQNPLFVLEKGTEVQLFVNESVSISM
jgi:hypothetical protein